MINKKPACSTQLGTLRNPLQDIIWKKEANGKGKVYTRGFDCILMLYSFKNKLFWDDIIKQKKGDLLY